MNTKGKKAETLHFVVLIPHRDAGRLLEEYRQRLFAAGFAGAFSFPAAAPLALVSRPFSGEELRALARDLRSVSILDGMEGRFRAGGSGIVSAFSLYRPAGGSHVQLPQKDAIKGQNGNILDKISFFGPELYLPAGKLNSSLLSREKAVLCAALIGSEEETEKIPAPPELFFRAAMAANLTIQPLSSGEKGYSFMWKIGRPVWLPSYKKPKG